MVKSSTTASVTAAGQVVPYTFTVTNTGNVTLTGVTVSDPKCDVGAGLGRRGDANGDSKLQPAETWVYTCTHTVTQAEIDAAAGNLLEHGHGRLGRDGAGHRHAEHPDRCRRRRSMW